MHPVWKFKAEAQAAEQGSTLQAVVAAAQAGKLGLCFSGAGFGAAYQLGAAQVLEALGILGPHTPVAGASAGSVVAVSTRCSLSQLEVLDALDSISQRGEAKCMRRVLRDNMAQLLPPDAYQLCSSGSLPQAQQTQARHDVEAAGPAQGADSRQHNSGGGHVSSAAPTGPVQPHQDTQAAALGVQHPAVNHSSNVTQAHSNSSSSSSQPAIVLGATRVRPACPACVQPDVFMGGYASIAELLDVLLAGAHLPRTSDGSLFARMRGRRYVDAGIRDPCPPLPGVDHTIIVHPVHNGLLTRPWPYRLILKPPFPEPIAISPGQYGRAWPYSRDYKASNKLVMHPRPGGVLRALFERGRRDALAWAQHIGLTADVVQQLRAWVEGGQRAAAPVNAAAAPAPAAQPSEGSHIDAGRAVVLQCLQLPVEQLPMLVPVPQDQMHLL